MANIWIDVDTAVTVPVNVLPLLDDTDFKTREVAVAYNAAGMDLVWNFQTTAGVQTQTAVTPTTGGDYDWTHVGDGMYKIEIPASGGASVNNDTEGFGWFTGLVTGVLPWTGPIIGFRAAAINNALIDSAFDTVRGFGSPTALPNAAADAAGGLPISDAGGLDVDAKLANTNEVTAARMGALTDWIDGGRLDLLLDAIPTTAMRGTDNAALAANAWHIARTGTAQAGAAKTITLDAGASASNDYYIDTIVHITGGTGAGQSRRVKSYVGSTKIATIQTAWVTIPDATSVFRLYPGGKVDAVTTPATMISTTIATVATQTSFTLTAGSADDDAYNDCPMVITDATTATQKTIVHIEDYTGSTKTVSTHDAPVFTIAAGDIVEILVDVIHADDIAAAILATPANLLVTDANGYVTAENMVGTDNAALASVCTEGRLAELDAANLPADVDTLLGRVTATIFSGITSLAEWLGLIAGKQAGDATARTELRATGAGSGTFDETADSAEAIRDQGDAAWITAAGFLDAAGVRTALGLASANLDTQLADLPTVAEFEARTIVSADYFVVGDYTAPLDAAGVRTAVGLASANLDTQLGDIPTVAEFEARTLLAADYFVVGDYTAPLDAAGVRSAVGLASANMDTQLSVIVTDTNELQTDWADGGRLDLILDAAAAGGSSGEGAYTGTLTVDDGAGNGLEGAVVVARRGGVLKASGTTNANGQITNWVFGAFTYTLAVRLAGYNSATDTLTVSADGWAKTVSLSAISITAPAAAELCTVQFRVTLSAAAVEGAVCKAKLQGINQASDGTILSNEELSTTTNALGVAELQLVQQPSIVKGSGVYKIWVEIAGQPVASVETTIPGQSTILFEDML